MRRASYYETESTEQLWQRIDSLDTPVGEHAEILSVIIRRQQQQINDLVTKLDLVAQEVGKASKG